MQVRFRPSTLHLACSLALVGCAGGVDDGRWATGSTTAIASVDYAVVHMVDLEGGTVVSYDVADEAVNQVEVGDQPARVARLGDRILVTLKGERAFAVLSGRGTDLTVERRIDTAAEPYGIVVAEDGSRIYVAAASSGVVQEFDGETFEFLGDWQVPGEPRWLALHPSGSSVYVGSAFGGLVSRIDITHDSVSRVEIPVDTAPHLETFESIDLTTRVTGDLAVSPDGRSLVVPALLVDNTTPVGEPTPDGFPNPSGYGGDGDFDTDSVVPGTGPGRFVPGLVTIPLDGSDGVVLSDGIDTVNVATTGRDLEDARSFVSSATFSPDGRMLYLTMEASNLVVSVPAGRARAAQAPEPLSPPGMDMVVPMSEFGFFGHSLTPRPTTPVLTDAGPRGVVFTGDDDAFVHNFVARTLTRFDAASVELTREDDPGATAPVFTGDAVAAYPSTLTPEQDLGRRLFFSAANPSMAAAGSGVSCSTCHTESRNDGLTWPLPAGPRNTPSLAGEVSSTAPVTWTGDVESVAMEVHLTSRGQMGGSGLTLDEELAVADFIDYTPAPDSPRRGIDVAAAARGEEIFHRAEVGCADCHTGRAWTDNEEYPMYGLRAVRTRGLVGIAASAPYLHDGSEPDLGTLLERSRDGSMGDTSSLDAGEMADLRVFLESL